ncbi:hypothetical protein CHR29_15090 [Pseudomonas monteilii]|nr:hypothetical protein CHR29_15090 [Pseudomonas monteilii]AYN99932.1 hypothetical protein D8767_13545 [Pseudomonas sp. LTGT-11-2Z]
MNCNRPFVGSGVPAKQAMRWMAPASAVFAGTPAPTGLASGLRKHQSPTANTAHHPPPSHAPRTAPAVAP